ncbi:hypothetical protein B296_00009723 [Ensete ventricosum]|uniref:Uncharacterized protein n=1 Tax=Ensete ventricosum TaxID=4639 RepID=A0A427BAD5_ENSVE|nr:hypothetical protein B296_00009723 [Ensete ventricosum]
MNSVSASQIRYRQRPILQSQERHPIHSLVLSCPVTKEPRLRSTQRRFSPREHPASVAQIGPERRLEQNHRQIMKLGFDTWASRVAKIDRLLFDDPFHSLSSAASVVYISVASILFLFLRPDASS